MSTYPCKECLLITYCDVVCEKIMSIDQELWDERMSMSHEICPYCGSEVKYSCCTECSFKS